MKGLVKDVWALRLQKLHNKVSYDADTDTEARSSQKFSSQSEGESGTDMRSRASRSTSRKSASGPGMTDLLCINYIAMLLLRIPVTVVDFHRWTNSGQLLFYQASKEIPLAMRDRLPGTYQANLEPQELLEPQALHRRIFATIHDLHEQFGIELPPINHRLILHRWMLELALPIEVYAATQRLGRLLEVNYNYLSDAGRRAQSMRYPELRLITLLVTVTKLLFPVDQIERCSDSGSDLDAMRMNWQRWAETHSDNGQGDGLGSKTSFEDAFKMTEADSLNLADKELDDYLDWCESNLASNDVRERGHAAATATFRRALFDMFPIQSSKDELAQHSSANATTTEEDTTAEISRQVQSTLQPRQIASGEGRDTSLQRLYRQYKTADEVEGPLRIFYERAAATVGYPLAHFTKAVFQMEKIIEKENAKLK
jgi:RNA polymerase I-specific transcription initiation factor RRN7